MLCKVFVTLLVTDLPAKAAVLSHTLFNGKHGCSYCTIEGEVVPKGRGHARVYSHQPMLEMRSHQSILENAKVALEENV